MQVTMPDIFLPEPELVDPLDSDGCAYILDADAPEPTRCGAPRHPDSSYCRAHRAACYLPRGSAAERRKLREIAALADAIGGTAGSAATSPPERLLRRLERLARASARSNRSRYVREQEDDHAASR